MTEVGRAAAPAGVDAPSPADPPAPVARCVVCSFVADAVDRRLFFLFAESIGDGWFLEAMRAGGFCLRHARRVFRAPDVVGMTIPIRELLRGWRARRAGAARPAGPTPWLGGPCPLCVTAAWAEAHALWILDEPVVRKAAGTLGADGPVCLPHLDRRLDARDPWRIAVVAGAIRARIGAAGEAGPDAALGAVAGDDVDRVIRGAPAPEGGDGEAARPGPAAPATLTGAPAAPARNDARARERGPDALGRALDAGACPACAASAAAARWPIAFLASAAPGEDVRDLDRLCVRHLHDAAATSPAAAARAVAGSLRGWWSAIEVLPAVADLPPRSLAARARWLAPRALPPGRRRPALGTLAEGLARPDRAPRRAIAAARLRRSRACVACEAATTAADRSLALLGALLAGRPWRDRFERSDGLCLRHVEIALGVLDPSAAAVVGAVADARAARLEWALDESVRRSSWSVRYEPEAPESGAWVEAFVFVHGEGVRRRDLLGPDGEGREPAA